MGRSGARGRTLPQHTSARDERCRPRCHWQRAVHPAKSARSEPARNDHGTSLEAVQENQLSKQPDLRLEYALVLIHELTR